MLQIGKGKKKKKKKKGVGEGTGENSLPLYLLLSQSSEAPDNTSQQIYTIISDSFNNPNGLNYLFQRSVQQGFSVSALRTLWAE